MALNPNPRMGTELCLIRLCRPELQDDPPALRARLERLEQAVQGGTIPVQPSQKAQSKPAPAPEPPVTPERPPLPEQPPVSADRPPFPEQPPRPSIPAEAPPVAESAPVPPAPGGFSWEALCAEMEQVLPVGLYSFLLDPLQASGSYDSGVLTLRLNKQLAFSMYNTPTVSEQFRTAVQKLTGQAAKVVMQPMDTAAQMQQRHIEELARFTNVTIK